MSAHYLYVYTNYHGEQWSVLIFKSHIVALYQVNSVRIVIKQVAIEM